MSTHLTVIVHAVEGVTIRCSDPRLIDALIALDTSRQGPHTQSAFGYTITSEQVEMSKKEPCPFGVKPLQTWMEMRGIKRTTDRSFREEDRKLWVRACGGRTLNAYRSAWDVATKTDKEDSISLEHVMDALAEAGFELVTSHSHSEYSNAANGMVANEKYIFRR